MAGCGNHGCWIEKPAGQGTNGRCKCLRALGKENEQALKRKLVALDKLTQERELLRLTAAMFLEASALYHQNLHDRVVIHKYEEVRAKFRDVFGLVQTISECKQAMMWE